MLHLPTRATILGLLVVGLLTLAACVAGESVTHDDTFEVGTAPVLVVQNDNGEVRVEAGESGSITVEADIRHSDSISYSATQTGDTVTVVAEIIAPRTSGARANITVKVPPDTTAVVMTGNGEVTVEGLRASATAGTGNGSIDLTDIEGDATAESGNGDISLTDGLGYFDLSTGNGKVLVTGGQGSFDLSTGNGDIGFNGGLDAGTSSSLSTGNGSVTVKFDGPPSVSIDAETGTRDPDEGRVKSNLEMSSTTVSDSKNLIGTVGEGAADLLIRTGNGDINIR